MLVWKFISCIVVTLSIFSRTSSGEYCSFSNDRQIYFNSNQYKCVKCAKGNTLTPVYKSGGIPVTNEETCERSCDGFLCHWKNNKCTLGINIKTIADVQNDCPPAAFGPKTNSPNDNGRAEKTRNHIPLIIGFAVGGIMLAVVIAGVLMGRANRGNATSDSSIVTTPVSMSYSEWISTGGWAAKNLNNRVQESSGSLSELDDTQSLAVYNIVYGESGGSPPEKYPLPDTEPTIIEVDEMGTFNDPNLSSFYEPRNDVLSCVTAPMRDEQDFDLMTWGNNHCVPYESIVAMNNGTEHFDSESYNHIAFRNSSHFERDCWSTVTSTRRDSIATGSIYSKRRDTWSDESNCDNRDYGRRFSLSGRHYGRVSPQNAWIRVPRQLSINFANLKHVFVDVHRSMSYSFDDNNCTFGYWAPSDGSGIFEDITTFEKNEKTNSYITIKSHYICCGSSTMPRMHDQFVFYSLRRNSHKHTRRCSI